jgi:quercetin dioxygenase-like cupin family protein
MEPAPFDPVAVDLRDYVDFSLDAATGRRVFTTDVLAVDLVCLEPRQVIEPRTFATADVMYTVIGGVAWIVTDDAQVTLQALQALLVPAGVPHGVRNDSADPLLLHMVSSPPDEAPPSLHGPAVTPASADRQPEQAGRPGALDRLRRVLGG